MAKFPLRTPSSACCASPPQVPVKTVLLAIAGDAVAGDAVAGVIFLVGDCLSFTACFKDALAGVVVAWVSADCVVALWENTRVGRKPIAITKVSRLYVKSCQLVCDIRCIDVRGIDVRGIGIRGIDNCSSNFM